MAKLIGFHKGVNVSKRKDRPAYGGQPQRGIIRLKTRLTAVIVAGAVSAVTPLLWCSSVAADNLPTFFDRQLFKEPVTAAHVDLTQLFPDCKPAKCNVDVWIQAVADFTGDGLPDVLIGSTMLTLKNDELDKPGPIILMKNDGHGGFVRSDFASGAPYLLAKHPRAAAVADFNGDGKLDVMIVSNGYDRKPFPGETVRLLLQKDGTLADSPADLPQIVVAQHGIAVGPFSGPGQADALIIAQRGKNHVDPYFLVNDGAGHFTKSSLPDRFPAESLRLWEATADNPSYRTAKVVDVDGDGQPDILLGTAARTTSYRRYNNSRILFNDGSDHWDDKHVFEFPDGAWGKQTNTDDFAVADVNGDGLPDVVMTTDRETAGPSTGARLRLFLNQGNRTFKEANDAFPWDQSQWDKQAGLLPIHVNLTDINADGQPDVVVSDISPIRKDVPTPYFIAINDGTGHFTPLNPKSMGRQFRGSHLWPADLTGTGRTDLVGLSVFGDTLGKQFQFKGFEIQTYENIPNGGTKFQLTDTTEEESHSSDDWEYSHLLTRINGGLPDEDQVDFSVEGNVAPTGEFMNMLVSFHPPLGSKPPSGLGACQGPKPKPFGDGQYRAQIQFRKVGSTWVAVDAACHMQHSSPLDSFMMKYFLTSFRQIASDMVAAGRIDSVKSEIVRNWLKRVAAGEVAFSDKMPKGVKPPRTNTNETGDYSEGDWVDAEFRTFIAGAKNGQDEVDFHIQGNTSFTGDFSKLELVFSPPIGKQVPKALGACGGPPSTKFGDGQYRVLLDLQRASDGWVAVDAACHIKAAPPLDAFMIRFLLSSFREVAADMVTSGNIDAVKSPVVRTWLSKVATGDIAVR